MPRSAPPVLKRLHDLGLTQTALAAYLGVTQAAVSLWLLGKRPFEEPWRADADALLAIVHDHLAQGKPLATVRFCPTNFLNRGGTTRAGEEAPLTPADRHDLVKLQEELRQQSPDRFVPVITAWHARRTATRLQEQFDVDPQTWNASAEDLDGMRRLAQAMVLHCERLLQIKAHKALEDSRNVDETR